MVDVHVHCQDWLGHSRGIHVRIRDEDKATSLFPTFNAAACRIQPPLDLRRRTLCLTTPPPTPPLSLPIPTPKHYTRQLSDPPQTHERIEHGLGAIMATVARGGGSRGGRGRGGSANVWRGSNTRGGLNGASSDFTDKPAPAFGAKKRGGGAPSGGSKARNNAQEVDEDGKPKT